MTYNFPPVVGCETGQGPTLIERACRIYNRSSVGCCLHILLDDGNTDDEDAQWVLDRALKAKGKEHLDCINVAMCLKHMTKPERDAFRNKLHKCQT